MLISMENHKIGAQSNIFCVAGFEKKLLDWGKNAARA